MKSEIAELMAGHGLVNPEASNISAIAQCTQHAIYLRSKLAYYQQVLLDMSKRTCDRLPKLNKTCLQAERNPTFWCSSCLAQACLGKERKSVRSRRNPNK